MNNQEKEFNQAAETLKGVSLSASEKNAMLKSIYEYAELGESETITKNIPSPFIYSSFFRRRTMVALTVVFLMTASTSYASLASLGSLPGDALYQMKVGVIEPIGLAVRFKEAERNEYRITLLKERVAEIERLKEDGRLMSYNEMVSSKAAQKNISAIEASSAFDAEAENLDISTHVETYNSIILDEALKLKTKIKVNIAKEDAPGKTSTTSPANAAILSIPDTKPVEKTIDEVTDVVEEVIDNPTKEVVTPVVSEVTDEVTDVVEEVVAPVVKTVVPIKVPKLINIGL